MIRTRVPLTLLAILAVLTAGFAVLGLFMAPSGAVLAVRNGTAATFGSPPGSVSFTLEVSTSVSAPGTSSGREVRLIAFRAPGHMAVYQTNPSLKLLGRLGASAILQVLGEYDALTGGSTPWLRHGSQFERAESLADFTSRVSRQKSLSGTVHETAVVRGGYLVQVHLEIAVPTQKSGGGQSVTGGTEQENFDFVRIGGTTAPAVNG
jgi:hypothetical protein